MGLELRLTGSQKVLRDGLTHHCLWYIHEIWRQSEKYWKLSALSFPSLEQRGLGQTMKPPRAPEPDVSINIKILQKLWVFVKTVLPICVLLPLCCKHNPIRGHPAGQERLSTTRWCYTCCSPALWFSKRLEWGCEGGWAISSSASAASHWSHSLTLAHTYRGAPLCCHATTCWSLYVTAGEPSLCEWEESCILKLMDVLRTRSMSGRRD